MRRLIRRKKHSWRAWIKNNVTWGRALELIRVLMPMFLEQMKNR
jgi:hypothetical protein